MKRFILIAGLSLVAGSAWAGPVGTWRVTDGTANIEIAPCYNALCGTVAWSDKPDQKDNKNPDVSLRNRPVLGIMVLQNMQPQGDKWVGSVYNARDGHTYDAKISMRGDDTLRMEGCLPGGVICGGQNWSRVAPPTVAAAPRAATPQPQANEVAVVTPLPPVGKESQAPTSVPVQQQATVIPQAKQETDSGLRPLDRIVPQITSDQAAAVGQTATDLINQMLAQHDVRGARIDPAQAAEAARSATTMINRYLR
jgi:uncharacterized protein (DUF2147 family)